MLNVSKWLPHNDGELLLARAYCTRRAPRRSADTQ